MQLNTRPAALIIFAALQQIKQTLHHYDEETCLKLRVANFINRGIFVGVVVASSSVVVLVVICAAAVSKIYCPLYLGLVCGP